MINNAFNARPSVNAFLAQPFVNYNMAHGWFLTSSPLITANWLAAPGQQWIVPVGGGLGRIFKLGDQPVSAQIQGFYNVARPTGAPSWQLRAELSLLFPERQVCCGSRLCENSDVELARRTFVSITLNRKRTALAVTVEGDKREDNSKYSLLAHVFTQVRRETGKE